MKNKIICWDSSVLISWIKGTNEGKIKEITPVVESLKRGDCNLVVSTLVYPEVLETAMPPGAIDTFHKFMQNKDAIETMAVDTRVAKKAQEIRNNIQSNTSGKLKTPDAIHIATAIISGATVFHTFDSRLLNLNETPEVDGLSITKCHIPGIPDSIF